MPTKAGTAGIRALSLAGLSVTCLCLALLCSPPPAESAQISIVHGKTTKIKEWPWQVALTVARRVEPQAKTRARFFCGGSLIAPDLVLTAGHCVADLNKREIRQTEIVSGRTRLNNESTGQIAAIKDLIMPMNSRGKRRYRQRFGVANWDFALLRLGRPLRAETIKLAGEDESGIWSTGRVVKTTGWGVTGASHKKASPLLRVASQVMLADKVCRRWNGNLYKPLTMNCIGGSSGNTSTCFGDSGGPLVAPIKGGYRLMGATSFGDAECNPVLPSIDTRIAGNPMRDWIKRTARRVSGVNVIGSGGIAPPERTWCQVPRLNGRTIAEARKALETRGCHLGKVRRDPYSSGRRGLVTGTSLVSGWLTPLGHRVAIWVSR